MKKTSACLTIVLCWAAIASGTLTGKKNVQCPVCRTDIVVAQWGGFGSYVYHSESKYDLVYFPDTPPEFIWLCPKCGYAQHFYHFSDVSTEESEALRGFLQGKWQPIEPNAITSQTRFAQAVLVSKFLNKDSDFWAWFYRILIYNYRTLDPEKARIYTKAEVELLENKHGEFQDGKKSRLYLLGEYNRMLGNSDIAHKYFRRAKRINLYSQGLRAVVCVAVIDLILLLSLVFIWAKRLFKLRYRIISTLALAAPIFLLSFLLYFSGLILSEYRGREDYYNAIIQERIQLLYDSSTATENTQS